jgi:hypothetical protein
VSYSDVSKIFGGRRDYSTFVQDKSVPLDIVENILVVGLFGGECVISCDDNVSFTQFVRRCFSILSMVFDRSECASDAVSEVPKVVNRCWSLQQL